MAGHARLWGVVGSPCPGACAHCDPIMCARWLARQVATEHARDATWSSDSSRLPALSTSSTEGRRGLRAVSQPSSICAVCTIGHGHCVRAQRRVDCS
eukprot:COSAG01_NODE_4179_length_5265_cov_15.857917_4_plen_97_part_00